MLDSFLSQIFEEYKNNYSRIFSVVYPAKNSTGFPERNLSVNFAEAYKMVADKQAQEAIVWYEAQFGEKNNNHLDALIVNPNAGEIILIESKRYSNPATKMKEAGMDIERIPQFLSELKEDKRIDIGRYHKFYGIILSDVWIETQGKESILDSYLRGVSDPESPEAFLNKYEGNLGKHVLSNVNYVVKSFDDKESIDESIKKSYKLLSLIWTIEDNRD